ncbi:MAG: hypothetical protein AAF512_26315, partial [Pseudomonadota bacterium]
RTGERYAWFGGSESYEKGLLTQSTVIPFDQPMLNFWLRTPTFNGEDRDYLRVTIDGDTVFEVTGASAGGKYKLDYFPVSIDISDYADNKPHQIRFESETFGNGFTSFLVDDIASESTGLVLDCKDSSVIDAECDALGTAMKDVSVVGQGHLFNVQLKGTISNQAKISDATILADVEVIEGTLSGEISNNGNLYSVTLENARLTGGQLSGRISADEQSALQDVSFAPNSHFSGGELSGVITGHPNAPALIENAVIVSGTNLSHVFIGNNVLIGKDAVLSTGVRFMEGAQLPDDVELIETLPEIGISDEASCSQVSNAILGSTILSKHSILDSINALPDMQAKGWVLSQGETGRLTIEVGEQRFNMRVVSVKRSQQKSGVTEFDSDGLTITTVDGLVVIMLPELETICELAEFLAMAAPDAILSTEQAGLVSISQGSLKLVFRPAFQSLPAADVTPGVVLSEASLVVHAATYELAFRDAQNNLRKQILNPSVFDKEALISTVQDLYIGEYGLISFQLNGQRYRGAVDALVQASSPQNIPANLTVIPLKDINGDGADDFMLRYTSGHEQVVFGLN